MRSLAIIAGVLALVASPAFSQGYNPSSVGQAIVTDCTVQLTSSGVPQRVLAQSGTPGTAQGNRIKIMLQNSSARTIGFSFTMGSALAITSTQQFVLTSLGSWTSDADLVPMNSIYAVGFANDILVCNVAGPS